MHCPYCHYDDTQVKDSRTTDDGFAIRRRRVCPVCSARFTTFERIQLKELTVLKRNNDRVPFDRDKLAKSVYIALRKRPVESSKIEMLVNQIQRDLENLEDAEVSTAQIGEKVMNALLSLDKVAYIRYASVYRNFEDTKDFKDFIKLLLKEETDK